MKLGFVSAILAEQTFEEVIMFASQNNFECVELMCWPSGNAERRYAGVTHVDVSTLTDQKVEYIKNYTIGKGVEISGLGYYPNPLDADPEKSQRYVQHLKEVIVSAQKLGVGIVNTFIGRDKQKNIDENMKTFMKVWTPLVQFAEARGVKVCIENCPMLFTKDEWPGGNNLAVSPKIWRKMFSEIDSSYFGLNYDPSHLLWQQIDYIKPIHEFKEKIFHVHLKDAKVCKERLSDVGILATPLEFHSPKIPGLGDIQWGNFVSALTDIGYQGSVCIEVEDRAFEESLETKKKALLASKNYLSQYIFGSKNSELK